MEWAQRVNQLSDPHKTVDLNGTLAGNQVIDQHLHDAQLSSRNNDVQQKRTDPQGMATLQHVNTRLHIPQLIKAAIRELGWWVWRIFQTVRAHSVELPPFPLAFKPNAWHNNRQRCLSQESWQLIETRPGNFWWNGVHKGGTVERWRRSQTMSENTNWLIDMSLFLLKFYCWLMGEKWTDFSPQPSDA